MLDPVDKPRRVHRAEAVLRVSHRSTAIAPISVRMSPPVARAGSTNTLPRGSHACERTIARLAPDSSRNTNRRTSTRPIHCRNACRSAWTAGRSCSAGRDSC
jgi:hypothetical protein